MEINKVESLLDIVNEKIIIYDEIKADLNKNYAMDFNPIEIFFPLGENKLSQILYFFLNPYERHYQQEIYLKAFLEYLDSYHKLNLGGDFKQIIHIQTEQPIDDNRRLDIYLTYSTIDGETSCIAIENKIWAQDQENQIIDYSSFLGKQKFKNHLLLYLTPHGSNPSTFSIKAEDFASNNNIKIIDHSAFTINLIEKWISITKPDPLRTFLTQTKNYLEKEINNYKFMDMEKIVIDAITPEKLNAAFAISNALPQLKNEVAGKFAHLLTLQLDEQLHVVAKATNITLGCNIKIQLTLPGSKSYVELNTDSDGLWYSIINPDTDIAKRKQFYNNIIVLQGGKENGFRYWTPFIINGKNYSYWYNTAEGMQKLGEGDTVSIAAAELKNLIELINQYNV
jgi:hypothetical protein